MQRLLNPRQDALFAEDLEQVVKAGAGGFAGHGQPAGMHQHAACNVVWFRVHDKFPGDGRRPAGG